MTLLDEEECWRLLASVQLGRLATAPLGQPEIFPVNFACVGQSLLIRSAEGTKLLSAVMNNHVAFEVDEVFAGGAWSVVVKGTAERLETQADLDAAEELELRTWTSGVKTQYLRIDVQEISGRRFTFAD